MGENITLKYQLCVVEFQVLFILCIQVVLYLKRVATSKIIEEGIIFLSVIPFLFKLVLSHLDSLVEAMLVASKKYRVGGAVVPLDLWKYWMQYFNFLPVINVIVRLHGV